VEAGGVKAPVKSTTARRRERLDRLLVRRGLAESREQAARLILSGTVTVAGTRVDKAGRLVDAGAALTVAAPQPFVSRGGEKLVHALVVFDLQVSGRVCLDVGASTGGFTHCLLSQGAAKVYAVDVGRGQLDQRLREDPRVVVMEKVNARRLDPRLFAELASLATVDVSFISLEKILPTLARCLSPPAEVAALVKPQFEVGRGRVGRGGVVRDEAQHREVLLRIARFAVLSGWHVLGVTASPLKGPKGNREFFLYLSQRGRTIPELDAAIDRAVGEGENL
jgi:23S rRNA (cytidine1920-2'-O)/16S rRNA (cytidine1409-2'-O)-methyltransferase